MTAKPKPGYVYVLENPLLQGWVKIGRTTRPPHKRAQELSTTAWPENFQVAHAKFFWDSVHAEQEIHHQLKTKLTEEQKKKEFFQLETQQAIFHVNQLNDPIWKQTSIIEESWDPSFSQRDMLEDRWQWAEEKLLIPQERDQGWRELEQLSAEGWADGSVRLAQKLMGRFNNPEHFKRASWVWQAAADQGAEGAEAWSKWCRTWPHGEGLQELLNESWNHYGEQDAEQWPSLLMDLFETEIFFWTYKPERALPHPWWGALIKAWEQESQIMGEDWNPQRRQAWTQLRNQTISDSNSKLISKIKPA